MLPGAGGLECDIGGVGDIIAPKRGSLDPGLVEVNLMLRVNKTLQELETINTKRLGSNWQQQIPKRPYYPADYFEDEEENEDIDEENDDDDSDSDSSNDA